MEFSDVLVLPGERRGARVGTSPAGARDITGVLGFFRAIKDGRP